VLAVIVTKAVFAVIVTITARFKCSAYNYCDNNGEVYMQC